MILDKIAKLLEEVKGLNASTPEDKHSYGRLPQCSG